MNVHGSTQNTMCEKNDQCSGPNICVPLKFTSWNLTPQGDGIRQWGPWELIRSWGWSLKNGISALIKGTLRALRPFHHKSTVTAGQPATQKGPSPEPNPAGILISEFHPPELWEVSFHCSLATQSMVLCYSSPNSRRQSIRFYTLADDYHKNIHHLHPEDYADNQLVHFYDWISLYIIST